MHPRYTNQKIAKLFGDENKLNLWQKLELAVLQAKTELKLIPFEVYTEIERIFMTNPIDIDWWKKRDAEIGHDLNAFLDERLRFLPVELQEYFHKKLTSYDTEESPFVQTLVDSLAEVEAGYMLLQIALSNLASEHRYTLMMARTHGQWAELQSFGKRVLTWRNNVDLIFRNIIDAAQVLYLSKLAGAIGNYGSISPEVEKKTLEILGLKPFYGASEIMPRFLYAPIAQNLCNFVLELHKVALDIRLGARSGLPILQEPFGKKQKGSSAMPHKKNTISTENIEGQARMAKGYMLMITENIVTWEERAIEQSCVERVAWPDLFHSVNHTIKVMTKIISGLTVYTDNMLQEIIDSRGTYASSEAKEFLKEQLCPLGFSHEDIYRLVQLACFNIFEADSSRLGIRSRRHKSFTEAETSLKELTAFEPETKTNLEEIIRLGRLRPSNQLEITDDQVNAFNEALNKIFTDLTAPIEWQEIFRPANLLKNEALLYKEILGE